MSEDAGASWRGACACRLLRERQSDRAAVTYGFTDRRFTIGAAADRRSAVTASSAPVIPAVPSVCP